MTNSNFPTCRGCGAPIRFVACHPTGKNHPIDEAVYEPKEGESLIGLLAVEDDQAGGNAFVVSQYTEQSQLTGRTLHKSHFASCPKAGRFRKRGK
jgi:hypothetical protein